MNRRDLLKSIVTLTSVCALSRAAVSAPPEQPAVILRLTPQEAQALANVCVCVGGYPLRSDRGHIDTVHELLREQGYDYQRGNVFQAKTDSTGRLNFNNYSEYQNTRPAGPGKPFQHAPSVRYLRRQWDGLV